MPDTRIISDSSTCPTMGPTNTTPTSTTLTTAAPAYYIDAPKYYTEPTYYTITTVYYTEAQNNTLSQHTTTTYAAEDQAMREKEGELNERLQDVTGMLGSAKKVHRKGKNIPFFFLSC
jgi:hypothetical protein